MNSQAIPRNPSQDSFDTSPSLPCWHEDFVKMLPKIQEHASYAFRYLKGDRRDEAIQEVVCNCCLAYARLIELGRAKAASWSSLAKYAVAQIRDGRRVGRSRNIDDVSSVHCQRRKNVNLGRLQDWDEQDNKWKEILVEDKTATPAELAASRIDFPAWLQTLSERHYRIALKLSEGMSTSSVARLFRISSGRVSQLRRELHTSWQEFHGEAAA